MDRVKCLRVRLHNLIAQAVSTPQFAQDVNSPEEAAATDVTPPPAHCVLANVLRASRNSGGTGTDLFHADSCANGSLNAYIPKHTRAVAPYVFAVLKGKPGIAARIDPKAHAMVALGVPAEELYTYIVYEMSDAVVKTLVREQRRLDAGDARAISADPEPKKAGAPSDQVIGSTVEQGWGTHLCPNEACWTNSQGFEGQRGYTRIRLHGRPGGECSYCCQPFRIVQPGQPGYPSSELQGCGEAFISPAFSRFSGSSACSGRYNVWATAAGGRVHVFPADFEPLAEEVALWGTRDEELKRALARGPTPRHDVHLAFNHVRGPNRKLVDARKFVEYAHALVYEFPGFVRTTHRGPYDFKRCYSFDLEAAATTSTLYAPPNTSLLVRSMDSGATVELLDDLLVTGFPGLPHAPESKYAPTGLYQPAPLSFQPTNMRKVLPTNHAEFLKFAEVVTRAGMDLADFYCCNVDSDPTKPLLDWDAAYARVARGEPPFNAAELLLDTSLLQVRQIRIDNAMKTPPAGLPGTKIATARAALAKMNSVRSATVGELFPAMFKKSSPNGREREGARATLKALVTPGGKEDIMVPGLLYVGSATANNKYAAATVLIKDELAGLEELEELIRLLGRLGVRFEDYWWERDAEGKVESAAAAAERLFAAQSTRGRLTAEESAASI